MELITLAAGDAQVFWKYSYSVFKIFAGLVKAAFAAASCS
jgi:hypothetical protein